MTQASGVELVPADQLSLAELTATFNLVYADYYLPLHVDEATQAFMIDVCDLVPAASRVARRNGESIAVALLGLRGARGWVGGMGVAPQARRTGLGEVLMRALGEQARARGLTSMDLEVLEQNAPARRLYEKLGFTPIRELEVWSFTAPQVRPLSSARPLEVADARAWLIEHRRAPEPWQRADASVDRLEARGLLLEALTVESDGERFGTVLFRIAAGRASVIQLAARDEDVTAELLDGILARTDVGGLRLLNVPASDPAASVLRARGATLEARQVEMRQRVE